MHSLAELYTHILSVVFSTEPIYVSGRFMMCSKCESYVPLASGPTALNA